MPGIGRQAPHDRLAAATRGPRRASSARTVLVVDGDPDIRAVIRYALQAAGYDVLLAANGPAALRIAETASSQPTIVVADLDLPGMGGVELGARLAAVRPGIVLVLTSARHDSLEVARDRFDHVRAVLPKPFRIQALLDAVTTALVAPGEAVR